MPDRKSSTARKLAPVGIFAANVIFLIVLFGHNTFSKDKSDRPILAEYLKEGSAPKGDGSALEQAVRKDQKAARPLKIDADLSKALLSVKGLSCSSCIQNIKDALSDIDGIEEILVDISRGTAQVYYNSKTLKEPDQLAEAITSGGYPASLVRIYSSEDLRKEELAAAAKAQFYIASVGGWEIARSDLDTQLEHAKKRYLKTYGENLFSTDRGNTLVDNLRVQIVSRLIDEGVMMQEITKAGYRVSAAKVEEELQKVMAERGKGSEDFKATLSESGMTLEYFKKRLETRLMISGYLEERILNGASNDAEKQALFTSWFNNAKILAEVLYYDKDLERLVQRQSAQSKCGG